jgi:hypothetical protein
MFASTEKVNLPHIENAFHARHPSTAAPTSDDSLYLREVVMQLVIICLFSYYSRRHFGRDLHLKGGTRCAGHFRCFTGQPLLGLDDLCSVLASWNSMLLPRRSWNMRFDCDVNNTRFCRTEVVATRKIPKSKQNGASLN